MRQDDLFWASVDKTDGCWPWTGYVDEHGYGRLTRNGTQTSAHRLGWELERGPIPDKSCVLHRCDNPPCVNPAHLFLGTRADNVLDMDRKNRRVSLRGDRHGRAKLTEGDAVYIRESGISASSLAFLFGVCVATTSAIKRGTAWRHLVGPRQ